MNPNSQIQIRVRQASTSFKTCSETSWELVSKVINSKLASNKNLMLYMPLMLDVGGGESDE